MAMRNILIAINGTHDNLVLPMNSEEYNTAFAGSHVELIFRKCSFPHKLYVRGPTGSGSGVALGLAQALGFIAEVQKIHSADALALHLVGFSRGAAMCLELANWLSTPKAVSITSWGDPMGAALCAVLLGQLNKSLIRVRALGMFDAVDMSLSMDCDPVDPRVERAVLIRRAGWHSREGWTNVGDTPPPATAKDAVRERWPLIGTHGAMGGQPVNGDIPIPLARELMTALGSIKQPANMPNWLLATQRWQQLRTAGSLEKVITAERNFYWQVKNIYKNTYTDVVDFHELLRSYANTAYMINPAGISAASANNDLFGFPGLFWIFQDIKICMGILGRFAALDRKASANALTLMRRGLGAAFPATL